MDQAQRLGTSDNSVSAVAGSSPTDVWAVGDFLPDAAPSNQDVTLTFAEHYNDKKWTVVRTANTGPNFNSFYAAAASQGWAWAVGEHLNSDYQDRTLIEVWNGKTWTIADNPQHGAVRDMLLGASALSPSDVWVVGDQEGGNGLFETLASTGMAPVDRRPDSGSGIERKPPLRGRRGERRRRVGRRPATRRTDTRPGPGRAVGRPLVVRGGPARLRERLGDAHLHWRYRWLVLRPPGRHRVGGGRGHRET